MSRQEIYYEMKKMFGLVPTFFKLIPDSSLELEWQLMKTLELDESPIPAKYRDLMGLGIAAVNKCKYCAFFHTELAKLNGATDEEIQATVQFAKLNVGWSAYLNGLQFDFEQFKDEVRQMTEHVRSMQSVTA
jgi:AhpD family alkylhydroperoxidase